MSSLRANTASAAAIADSWEWTRASGTSHQVWELSAVMFSWREAHMPSDSLGGTPEEVRRILRAAGPDREALLRRQFGDEWTDDAAEVQLYRTESGLWIPPSAASPPDSHDFIKVYLTLEEILDVPAPLSMDAIIRSVSKVSMELAVAWAAAWIAKLQDPARSHGEVDSEFVEMHFRSPHKEKVRNLLRDPRRLLLTPQTLIVITKLALEHCDREGPPPEGADVLPLVKAMLALPSHLGIEGREVSAEELVVDVNGGRMATYLVANQMFNNPADWRSAWAIYHRCLRELPRELASHPRIVDFEAAYLDATGVPLDDVITICSVLWSRAISKDGPTLPLSYFDPLKWDADRLNAVLHLISATPMALRAALREDVSELGLLWSTKTFDQFPIVRWDDHLTVLHASWVVNRSTGLWPLLDVRRALETRGDKSQVSRVAGSVEHTHEHYGLEVLEDIAGKRRVYRDEVLRKAYGKKGSVTDAVVEYGDSWVVVEVATKGFQLKTAAGVSEESLGQDLDNIVKKAQQVQATIDNLRTDEGKLTGRLPFPGARRFFPVVVVASRFAGNPITYTMLRARLRDAAVLQAPDCAPLEVMELEDLLAVEGTCESHGLSLLDLLAEKAATQRSLMGMKEFLSNKLGHNAPYPERVERSWEQWANTAIRHLREAGSGGDDAPDGCD